MKRILVQTVLIQSLGVLMSLGTVLLVARLGGPSTQGQFALVKSFNDLQVAIFSFGLPQGIAYVLNKTGRGFRNVHSQTYRYTALLLFILPTIDFFVLRNIHHDQNLSTTAIQAILIGCASALLTGYSLSRGLVLTRNDTAIFSWISVLPTIVLALFSVSLVNRINWAFEIAYLFSGMLSILITMSLTSHYIKKIKNDADTSINVKMLIPQSGQVFFQAVLLSSQIFISNYWLNMNDPTLSLAGLFNISSMLITIPNLLVSFIAPVLFNRWSKNLDFESFKSILKSSALFGGIIQICCLVALPMAPLTLPLVFGHQFALAVGSAEVLAFSIFAVIVGRILTPALQGVGLNRIVTLSCAARLAMIAVTALIMPKLGFDVLISISAAWVMGEYTALAILVAFGSRQHRWLDHRSSEPTLEQTSPQSQ